MLGEAERAQQLVRQRVRVLLQCLAAQVFLVELPGQLGALVGVRAGEQPVGAHGVAQPPAGVQARRELEGYVPGADHAAGHAARVDQRADAGAGGHVDSLETQRGNRAVFILKRHDVRNRRQRGQIHIIHRRVAPAQRRHELKHHARAAQIGERIVVQKRIHDRAGRQLALRPMVVGNHDAHAARLRQLRQLHRGNAAVHRHQQPVLFAYLQHRALVQPVALLVPGGQIHVYLRADGAQIAGKNGRGANAVHVVVAVYADALARVDGRANLLHGLLHVRKQERVAQLVAPGAQEGARFFLTAHAAKAEQPVKERGHIGGTRPFGRVGGTRKAFEHRNPTSLTLLSFDGDADLIRDVAAQCHFCRLRRRKIDPSSARRRLKKYGNPPLVAGSHIMGLRNQALAFCFSRASALSIRDAQTGPFSRLEE